MRFTPSPCPIVLGKLKFAGILATISTEFVLISSQLCIAFSTGVQLQVQAVKLHLCLVKVFCWTLHFIQIYMHCNIDFESLNLISTRVKDSSLFLTECRQIHAVMFNSNMTKFLYNTYYTVKYSCSNRGFISKSLSTWWTISFF